MRLGPSGVAATQASSPLAVRPLRLPPKFQPFTMVPMGSPTIVGGARGAAMAPAWSHQLLVERLGAVEALRLRAEFEAACRIVGEPHEVAVFATIRGDMSVYLGAGN